MKRILSLCTLALTLGLGTGAASANTAIPLDPHHTSATFTVAHLTITKVSGQIPLISSNLVVNDKGIPTAAQATFDIGKIETQDDHRDADLRSDKWFNAAQYPTMTFHSTAIRPGADNSFDMSGNLSFHGETHPVMLHGTYAGKAKGPDGKTHMGYTASGIIDRTKWGVGTGAPPAIVGDDITITIQAEAVTP